MKQSERATRGVCANQGIRDRTRTKYHLYPKQVCISRLEDTNQYGEMDEVSRGNRGGWGWGLDGAKAGGGGKILINREHILSQLALILIQRGIQRGVPRLRTQETIFEAPKAGNRTP